MKQQFDGFLASPSFQRLYPCALVIDSNNCSIQMGADPAVPMADLVVLNVGAVAGNNCIQLNHTTITIFDCIATRNRDRILALVAFLRSTRPVDNALQQPTTTLLHIAELQSSISLCKSEHLSVNKRLLESTSANLKLVNAKVNPADGALAVK